MRLYGCRQILAAATILVAACCVSCNRDASNTSSAGVKGAKPGPEESFRQIFDLFRRRMEDTPIGFVMTDVSGRTMMSGANKVSYKLIRPTSEGEPYKAVVTVTSQSHYSIKRTIESSDENARDKNAHSQSDDPLAEQGSSDDLPFDSSASSQGADESAQPKPTGRSGEEAVVSRRPNKEERNYELIYENGRWNLVTKLDPETEQATQNAFKNALDTQI